MPLEIEASVIEDAILSVMPGSKQKVAMTLLKAWDVLVASGHVSPGRSATDDDCAALAERVIALVRQGRLEGYGPLDQWRHSEVRRSNDQ